MNKQLTFRRFQSAAQDLDEAKVLVAELGDLAPWIVRLDIRQLAAEHSRDRRVAEPPVSHPGPGSCQIVIACDSEIPSGSILDEGFLLPLRWQPGGAHDPRLPEPLRQTADYVLRVLELNSFSLHLMHAAHQRGPVEALWPDLLGDQMQFSSAFVPLAGSLLMLEENQRYPNRAQCQNHLNVATGSWSEDSGICSVGGIFQKTRAVADFPVGGEPRIRDWFVPASNQKKADETLDDLTADLKLHSFPGGDATPRRALARLLAMSGVRPSPNDDLNVLVAHEQFLRDWDEDEADNYYQQDIVPQVVRRCVTNQQAFEARPKCLVSVVSSPPLIEIATSLLRPENVLILYTKGDPCDEQTGAQKSDFADRAKMAEGVARKAGAKQVELRDFVFRPQLSGDALKSSVVEAMEEAARDYLNKFSPGEIIWDMTSGLRIFTLAIDNRLAREDDWMLCVSQAWSAPRNERIPLTESAVLWQHGRRW